MRVAVRIGVIDLGTNSTRLLVAEVEDRRVREVDRASQVTRLGRGVDISGRLATEAIDDVCETVGDYIERCKRLETERLVAIATSAVRDAANAAAFQAELRERFALESRILDGETEARLTFLGATAERPDGEARTVVVDVGGGSTELILGSAGTASLRTSLQAGVVRHTERFVKADPPGAGELEKLADDVRGLLDAELGGRELEVPAGGIGVAGTATSLAAIDLGGHDPALVHGHRMSLSTVQRLCSRLSAIPLAERREVAGLQPGRAPTIVAGTVILIQVMRAFELDEIEISERDILHGAALDAVSPVEAPGT